MCFFRVYEEGKPAKLDKYLKWSKAGAKEDELVFVSGHPGHTDRLNTIADLEYNRDIRYPFALQRLNRLEVMLSVYSELDSRMAGLPFATPGGMPVPNGKPGSFKDFLKAILGSAKAEEDEEEEEDGGGPSPFFGRKFAASRQRDRGSRREGKSGS